MSRAQARAQVILSDFARSQLYRLRTGVYQRVRDHIERLGERKFPELVRLQPDEDPGPGPGLRSTNAEGYRVFYELDTERRIVSVVRIEADGTTTRFSVATGKPAS